MSGVNVIEASGLTKAYSLGSSRLEVLKGVSLNVTVGEVVALLGPSGSGKSTLMDILGLLTEPDSGEVRIAGQPVPWGNDAKLTALRNRTIGFVFQSFHLLPKLTALDNVALPLFYAGTVAAERHAMALKALNTLGMSPRALHYPNQLSGGERQRVAIARAIVTNPAIILADEPTGNLDSVNSSAVMDILVSMASQGRAILIVTHDQETAARAGRIIRMRDGVIVPTDQK